MVIEVMIEVFDINDYNMFVCLFNIIEIVIFI